MKSEHQKFLIFGTLLILLTCTSSCSGRSGRTGDTAVSTAPVAERDIPQQLIGILSPEENTGFKLHQPVKVNLALIDKKLIPDSVTINFNGSHVTSLKSDPWEYSIPPQFTTTTGRKSLKVTAFRGGKAQNTVTRFMIFYSDVVPRRYGYKVIHTFPHDIHAFTQGLVYDNGVLLEGTGQETGSTLREVELQTGKVIRQLNIDPSLFGEGIALYQNHIYQVTWKNKVGFIYNRSDFKLINKIYYSTEGWGLTTVNDRIVMSDGTNVLYFFEPEMFTVESKLEVYDNEKKVDQLNELEYINGEIWANIWMTDLIARIDPASGKVLAYIDMQGLLPSTDRTADTDVLNGIAYDQDAKRIFVTGKLWPKLFEIRVTE
jgi:glutaminyl-peptide cyclotransferase